MYSIYYKGKEIEIVDCFEELKDWLMCYTICFDMASTFDVYDTNDKYIGTYHNNTGHFTTYD